MTAISSLQADAASPIQPEIARVLEANWDFAEIKSNTGLHVIHPYPARFIPQLPRQLINLLRPPNSGVIFDPFCGSGTSLVEAQALGFRSVGIDLNPIATLLTKVKTTLTDKRLSEIAQGLVDSARLDERPIAIPAIPRVDHWFDEGVQEKLAVLTARIQAIGDEAIRQGLMIAVSSIIVRVSRQDGDTRYAAVQKGTKEQVYELFVRAAAEIDRSRDVHFQNLYSSSLQESRVITADVLSVKATDVGPVDLVITSPPYPNAYEYWLYHKYRMYWLGFDPIAVKEAEIGARPHFFKSRPQTEDDFELQMEGVFRLLDAILRPNGLVCFVVGDSKIHGRIVDNVALLIRAAASQGFGRLAVMSRAVPAHRKAFNPKTSRAISESIAIFGKC